MAAIINYVIYRAKKPGLDRYAKRDSASVKHEEHSPYRPRFILGMLVVERDTKADVPAVSAEEQSFLSLLPGRTVSRKTGIVHVPP